MAAQVIDQVEEEAADLQFPKGNYTILSIVLRNVYLNKIKDVLMIY
jgi:hypothetical protein